MIALYIKKQFLLTLCSDLQITFSELFPEPPSLIKTAHIQ